MSTAHISVLLDDAIRKRLHLRTARYDLNSSCVHGTGEDLEARFRQAQLDSEDAIARVTAALRGDAELPCQ